MLNLFKKYIYDWTWGCPCDVPNKCTTPCSRAITPTERFVKEYIISWWSWDGITAVNILNRGENANFWFGKSKWFNNYHLGLFGITILPK